MSNNITIMGPHLLRPVPEATDEAVTAESFRKKLKIQIYKYDEHDMEFDVIGIYPGLINAFRRILISEVPSMAVEKVYIHNNTSIVQDEVLAQRIGLVPLLADARLFDFHDPSMNKYGDKDSLQFELKVTCTKNLLARQGHHRPQDKYLNHNVFSGDMKWVAVEGQESVLREEQVGPVQKDILLAKLRPSQHIHCRLVAVKGIGRDHAKFSPVATAWYRLHPHIELREQVEEELAERLQACFSPGVIALTTSPSGKKVASVKNARLDMCSRNHYRYEELKDKVVTGRINDHYIFTVESCVGLSADELFKEAVKVLKKKCTSSLRKLEELRL